MFPDDDTAPTPSRVRYVCAQCGKPGVPDPGFALIDPRYATGRCTGTHVGTQHLVREDQYGKTTEKRKPRRRGHAADRQG